MGIIDRPNLELRGGVTKMAPGEGIEPPTRRLTAARSASLSYPGTWKSYKTMLRGCQGRIWGLRDVGPWVMG